MHTGYWGGGGRNVCVGTFNYEMFDWHTFCFVRILDTSRIVFYAAMIYNFLPYRSHFLARYVIASEGKASQSSRNGFVYIDFPGQPLSISPESYCISNLYRRF